MEDVIFNNWKNVKVLSDRLLKNVAVVISVPACILVNDFYVLVQIKRNFNETWRYVI